MGTVIRRNERSWAIELISKINEIVTANDLVIKKAGGESTVSTRVGNNMFPDVILYGNIEQSVILQGWELKMPDIPIEDETFIKDAQRKAEALGLTSCVIWNFTYAVLYVKDKNGNFTKIKHWNDTNFIHSRDDVEYYRKEWESLLTSLLFEINNYFIEGKFRKTLFSDVISTTALVSIIQRNQDLTASFLKEYSNRNSIVSAYINNWWNNIKNEYEHDEKDCYSAYAKSVILNWINRILFAHIIKQRQNSVKIIDKLDYEKTPVDGNKIFKDITQKCDYYNIFESIEFNEILPEVTWKDFIEFSLFLKENNIENMNQKLLQNILEGSINVTKRELNGQFTTPPELAKILVKLSVVDWKGNVFDCCCGTGTIARAAYEIKEEKYDAKLATETVWASDKYTYPLQVANISMASSNTINLANRLFQKNALTLDVSDEINLINPETGDKMILKLPLMDTIVSNLPFVEFEKIQKDDKELIQNIDNSNLLDARSDLWFYIVLKLEKVLKQNSLLGIITSNSWLGTEAGRKFIRALEGKFSIQQIHISGEGRWFKNAKVVTTIIILKKSIKQNDKIQFILWKKSLDDFKQNKTYEDTLINSSLLGKELDSKIISISDYSFIQVKDLLKFNISYNAFFHKIDWLSKFNEVSVSIDSVFNVFRGSRRGWDAMFYPKNGEHHIEERYLQNVLINARSVDSFEAMPDGEAFCCDIEIKKLRELNHNGALDWIDKFINQKNGVGKPLTEVLKKKNMLWYELKTNEIAELFTTMNPDQRLFFAKFKDKPAFINQRLIGFRHKEQYTDLELYHALLNSVFTMFCIEASGFGRGMGALDINKDNLAKCRMFNPTLVAKEDRNKIIEKFAVMKNRKIQKVSEEINSSDRLEFEKAVFSAFGLENELDKVINSLKSMQYARLTSNER